MAGYEPGDHHWIGAPPRTFAEATKRPLAHVPIFLALDAPLGIPVDEEPRTAARRAATLLAELGHDVVEQSPDWNDETFPSAWSTFVTGALQHIVRVLERLHDRPVDPELAEPATRAWLLDRPPVTLLDYLEAQERLIAFSRRILRSWPPDAVLVTPTLTRLPAPADSLRSQAGVTDDAVRFSGLVRLWNVTGQPAIRRSRSRYTKPTTASRSASNSSGRPAEKTSCSHSPPSSKPPPAGPRTRRCPPSGSNSPAPPPQPDVHTAPTRELTHPFAEALRPPGEAITFRSNPACGSPPRSTCAALVVVPLPEWSP